MSSTPVKENFQVAISYGAAGLLIGSVGAVISNAAASTAAIIFGLALCFFGVTLLLGSITYGLGIKNPEEFREKMGKPCPYCDSPFSRKCTNTYNKYSLNSQLNKCRCSDSCLRSRGSYIISINK